MDPESDPAPNRAQAPTALPSIFQTPTYPSGERATRAPERTPEDLDRGSDVDGAPAPKAPVRRAPTRKAPSRRTEQEAAAPEKARAPERAPEPEGTTEEATSETSDDSSDPPRRRRRRGGRGRGGRGRSGRSEAEGDTVGTEIAEPDPTPASQRDDAQPDASAEETDGDQPATKKRRRRRGGRGRGRSAPAPAGAEAPAQPARTRGPKTIEEQVAAGGPTRGLRSRSRRGRDRRPREHLVTPPRITDKLMVITEHGERDQIAVLEENVLVQHYVTRRGAHSMVGNVYLGRIQNVLPGMEAAFVDIGRGRNGVLYAGEVNYSPEDLDGGRAPRIEQVLKSGQAVMVQVTKDPMGGKGARLTAQISLPGRFLVLAPGQDASGISRRLSEEARKRLKTILNRVKPKGDGVIVRTAAEGASEQEIEQDLERLTSLWSQIQKTGKKAKAPAVLYEEPELTVRVVRDLFTDEEFRGLVTDSERVHDKVMEYVRDVAPDLAAKVTLHRGPLSVFEEYRIVEQIHKALDRKVWLPSGGYLIIEQTEAMTIIDVNTGKAVGKTNLEETVLNTNLEAAREVARQLRLRDIGGIIVIDFIDLLLEQNKRKVEDTMREALAIDKTRSQVFEIGPLGLMQVTRKRVSGGLVDSFSETCPTCEGRGIIVHYDES
jgi:ribonuclease E